MSFTVAGTLILVLLGNDPFSENVRSSDPLPAEEQAKRFHVPDGFEVQLVAAEPEIQKPMNLAFDARGRLWVSGSVEYPYAAEGTGRDAIKILEDRDGDGRADRIVTFADQLNIPMGLYPYRDGVVAYSISSIDFFRDTDGDDVANERHVLYGPLDRPRDTHGMQNAFRRGPDGWLYVNHGFANETTISAADGSKISLHSGNTYRIRLDGSRVEQYSWGQVNPFGSDWTDLGDLVTADCHSKPLTLLLRGAYYSSFGKPHDGLGFAPELMSHHHGSTGLAGVAFYETGAWPDEYRQNLFVGNVVTSRIHRDQLVYDHATPAAVEQPDFLTCDDPWFRPVDVRFGPDGALYIADFYNRIIGHYEVPLEHPGRDRTRGRIWRVVYRGKQSAARDIAAAPDLTNADVDQLIAALSEPSPAVRQLAMDQLSDRVGMPAAGPLRAWLAGETRSVETGSAAEHSPANWQARASARWVLFRLNVLDHDEQLSALDDKAAPARTHGLKMLGEAASITPELRQRTLGLLGDPDPHVRRAATQTLGRHPHPEQIKPLLAILQQTASVDPLLHHAAKIALREHLADTPSMTFVLADDADDAQRAALVPIARAVPTPLAAELILQHLERNESSPDELTLLLEHVSRNVSPENLGRLAKLARQRASDDLSTQVAIFRAIQRSANTKTLGGQVDVSAWGSELVGKIVAQLRETQGSFQLAAGDRSWAIEPRMDASGNQFPFWSSLPGGEGQTSRFVSQPFRLPNELSFELCGHRGDPATVAAPPGDQLADPVADVDNDCFVQLRLVQEGTVIRRAYPPRQDHAVGVAWDLTDYEGQEARLELVDALNAPAYAWLAIARIRPEHVALPARRLTELEHWQTLAAELIGELQIDEYQETLRDWISTGITWSARGAAVQERMRWAKRSELHALGELLGDETVSESVRAELASFLAAPKLPEQDEVFERYVWLFQFLSTANQQRLGRRMTLSSEGSHLLVRLVERGVADARMLQPGTIRAQLEAAAGKELAAAADQLVAGLPASDTVSSQLITEAVRSFDRTSADLAAGKVVFEKNCQACHQLSGKGALVGPQLDGIGSRGLDRLAEDILTPHRNVDQAFRATIMTLTDGRVISGLVRQVPGPEITVVDTQGKELRVPREDVETQDQSPLSIMPDNFGEVLSAEARRDLLAFLLEAR